MHTKVKPYDGRLVMAEHAYRRYCLDISPGISLQDLLEPQMWSQNTEGQLRPRDIVCVRSATEHFDCELVVVSVLPGAGVVMALRDSGIPGSPTWTRFKAIEAEVRAEEEAKRQAEITAALAGGTP